MVVATDEGGERHAADYPRAAMPTAPRRRCCSRRPALAACGGDDEERGRLHARPRPPDGASPPEEAGCEKVAQAGAQADDVKLPKPTKKLERAKTYVADVLTNCGDFEITLDAKRAPKTGGSFASLADKGFYDGLTFHRIVPGFVIQGGDPRGQRLGRPGLHGRGAAARGPRVLQGRGRDGQDRARPAGTSGSQFFVVTGEDAGLPPDYALLGKVTKGQEVVDKIGASSRPGRAARRARVIESITV